MPISPITATASTNFQNRGPEQTVGGFNFAKGLTAGNGPVDPDTGLVFPQHNNVPDQFMWLSAQNAVPASITFDLGASFSVDRVWIYNYNENSNNPGLFLQRGAKTTGDVSTSLDGVNFTPLPSASNIPLTKATGLNDYDTPDVISLGRVEAQFVRFENLEKIENPGADVFVGLSEVIFFEGIPEPSTLLLAILGLLGFATSGLRCRKRR